MCATHNNYRIKKLTNSNTPHNTKTLYNSSDITRLSYKKTHGIMPFYNKKAHGITPLDYKTTRMFHVTV